MDDEDDPSDICSCIECKEGQSEIRCMRCKVCYFKHLAECNPLLDEDQLQRIYKYHPDDSVYHELSNKKYNGGGAIGWLCAECLNIVQSFCNTEILPNKDVEDKPVETNAEQTHVNETLMSLKRESTEMKGLLDNVMSRLDSLACLPASPKRKLPKLAVAWSSNDDDNPVMNMISDMNDESAAILPVNKRPMDYSSSFKMNISSNADNEGTSNLLKDLHSIKGDMPVFTGNRKYDGSVDIVFQNLQDATKAKNVLDTKLKNVNVKNPMPKNLKRFNLVGLQFDMNCNEVVDALIDENKHLFELQNSSDKIVSIKGDPTACIHVHQVSKCRGNGYIELLFLFLPT